MSTSPGRPSSPSRHVSSIAGRLSLRTPQRRSLEILDRVMEISPPQDQAQLASALSIVRGEFPTVEDFERAFPSLCFALATGVGKTRLMGAFIAYLHLEHDIHHFFVLAPNLTIYNKLIADFTPHTPKYVFQGIAEFAARAPTIITSDNYEHASSGARQQQAFDHVEINIFNIAKFNVRTADSRKIRRLTEYLGQSYFDYLAGLKDLVLIMDEAHRYRADSSMKSIEELKPLLGIELTATPQIEAGNKATRFKNVIFDYPLAQAMRDGYVKEPAVATRADFNPRSMEPAALERLKLEDGIRVHESTKVDLEVYAQQNSLRRVKPFMLVIASDTEHADQLVKVIESEEFFDGRYKGRVIQVHSGQKGAERDENVERLLAVEDPDEPTEVVVHVNMLKEGWDVTNLYTIVPLRSADSRTLVEQSIGRGLRLPYGRRTGVAAVDRLTIVAHDRFQDIVDEAKRGGYSFSTIQIGIDVPDVPKETVTAVPVFEKVLGLDTQSTTMNDASQASWGAATGTIPRSPAQAAMARLAVEAIARMARDPKVAPNTAALRSQDVQQRLVDQVATNMNLGQLGLFPNLDTNELASTVKQVTDAFIAHTIAIPRVQLIPQGIVEAGFHAFTLELSSLRLQPVAKEIIVENLTDHAREIIGALEQGLDEDRLEDYVVRGLIDFDDVCYDEQADLLYGLAGQVVSHLRGYLSDDAEVRNVLLFHQRQIANLVHTQMQPHSWEKAAGYELKVSQGFAEVRREKFAKPITEGVRPFGVPIDNKIDIRQMLFGGFKKCVYAEQKFDSDVERRFAVILEGDSEVQKWLKPGKGDFQIRYTKDNDYEPDFVVETETEKLICEPKRADQMQDPIVQAKAKAAKTWCQHAADHERKHGGKPWRYVLIPHDAIADNMTVRGLAERFGT